MACSGDTSEVGLVDIKPRAAFSWCLRFLRHSCPTPHGRWFKRQSFPKGDNNRHYIGRSINGGYGTGQKDCHFRVEGGVALT